MYNKRLKLMGFAIVLLVLLLLPIAVVPTYAISPTTPVHEVKIRPRNRVTESIQITIGRNTSAVIEQTFTGQELIFNNINPNDTSFDGLTEFIIAGRNGLYKRKYWPHPLWPIPEGLYVGLTFRDIDEDIAVSHSETIISMVEAELGVSGFSLYGYAHSNTITKIVYYLSYSVLPNYTFDNFIDFWAMYLPSGGLADLVNINYLKSAPVSIALLGMFRRPGESWATVVADAYLGVDVINENEDGTFTISVNSIFGHEGNIVASENASLSAIRVLIPYVGNVTYYYPETDNLFPDMSGEFLYLLKPRGPVENNNVNDIVIKYNLAFYAEPTFPLLETRFEIDPALPKVNFSNPIDLTFKLTVKNVGESYAYNIVSAIPLDRNLVDKPNILGDRPINVTEVFMHFLYVSLLKTEINGETAFDKYFKQPYSNWNGHNVSMLVFWLYLKEVISKFEEQRMNLNVSQMIWLNVTITSPDMTLNRTFLGANFRDLVAYVGKLSSLAPNETVEFNVTIHLPGFSQILDPIEDAVNQISYPTQLTFKTDWGEIVFSVDPELGNVTRDAVVNATEKLKNDLAKNVSSEIWSTPIGPFTYYEDKMGHHFWEFANGFATQINDNQPVLVPIASINDLTVLIGQEVNISLNIGNIGDVAARNVHVTFYHAIADYNWSFRDISVIKTVSIGDIDAGTEVTATINVTARTRIGIHPIYANVTFTDDDGRQITIFSSMVFAIVLPKFAEKPKPDYPFPTPELNVTKTFDKYVANVSDIITVTINITNVGDEDTRIIVVDTVNSSAFDVIPQSIKVYRDGEDITNYVTKGIAFDRVIRGTHITAIFIKSNVKRPNVGVYLKPNQTLTITYQLRVRSGGHVVIYPLLVHYTALYPVYASEVPSESQETSSAGALSLNDASKLSVNDILRKYQQSQENQVTTYSASFTVALQEAATTVFPLGKIVFFAGIAMIIVAIVIVIHQRRRKQVVAQFS
ncbi:MAG: hypothetical protein ACP6IS_03575 [Candidatus Asgardarchaeia archaeon]